jgi:hypothetical protein
MKNLFTKAFGVARMEYCTSSDKVETVSQERRHCLLGFRIDVAQSDSIGTRRNRMWQMVPNNIRRKRKQENNNNICVQSMRTNESRRSYSVQTTTWNNV